MLPLQITYRGIEPSDALSALVEKRADKLFALDARVTHCHVAIEAPHQHHRHGNHYRVSLRLSAPGESLVVARDPSARALDEDPYIAVEHAFDVMRRRLVEELARRRHGMTTGGHATIRGR